MAFGNGSSVGTAELKTPNTYLETLLNGENNAYYNVTDQTGYVLTVIITYSYPTFDLDLTVHRPDGNVAGTSSSFSTTDSVAATCNSNLNYTIRILRFSRLGYAAFTLTITLTEAPPISGFELFFLFYNFALLLGIALYHKYRKSI